MSQRKLFRRALPVILSVAMVFQSVPATALAAEGDAPQIVEQITEETSEPESTSTKESSESESAPTEEGSRTSESASTEGSSTSESASAEESRTPESASSEESSETESVSDEEDSDTESGSDEESNEVESESESESETESASEMESESEEFSMNLPPQIPFEIDATDIYAGLNQSDLDLNAADVSAEKYDPRDTGTMTAVKSQGQTSTCWAFALTAAMENSMIMQGLADNSIDLSERHLAYFSYNTGCDSLGNASDDKIETDPLRTYRDAGGNTVMPTFRLMNWQGMASESGYPFSESAMTISADAAQDAVALAHDVYFVPLNEATTEQKKTVVKELISKYGSVAWSYGHIFDTPYYNDDTAAYYNPNSGPNHEITIVGWDDTFSKNNFNTTPEGDGAWIVKNSWDSSWGDGGYFYISYYDASLGSGNPAAAAVACATDSYDNNYFYGNTFSYGFISTKKAAQVFKVKGSKEQEKLTAVSVMMDSDKADYAIQIYKNPDMVNGVVVNPESGVPMLDAPVTGTTGYAGLYTIDLPEPITFDKDDEISIVISFSEYETLWDDVSDEWEVPLFDGSGDYKVKLTNTTHLGQSFYDQDGWRDAHDDGFSIRINALTVDVKGSAEEDARYKVTFLDADGNVINAQTVKEGGSAIAPPAPIRKGYVFKNWDKNYNKIVEDTVLSPVYELADYTIRYELGGGTNADTNPTKYTVESDDITLADPTREGYVFQGWYEQSDFSGTPVTAIPKGSAGELTLYAKWRKEGQEVPKYTVIFKDADGNQIGEAQQVEEGTNAIPPTAPEREGYTFKGWSGSYEKIMADTTLTAEYTPTEYTITYVLNVNGAINAESNPTKYTIESDKIVFADPTCEGYLFRGWYDNSRFNGEKITEIPKGSTGNLTLYAKWHEAKGLWMTDVDDQTYTGKAVKPDDFTVYDGLAELTKGVDYTVSYQNNVNANTNGGDKAPCVIIKGKGNYAGTVTKTFKILPADLAEAVVDDIAVAYKNGGVQTPKPVVKWSGKKLTLNKDYELKQAQSFTNPGTYTVTVSGKGNFAGEKSFQFIIMNGDQKLISSVKKSKIPDQSYTGKAVTVTGTMLKLTDKTYTLAEGTDYTLEYGACINAGTYEVLIRGLGKYQGITRTSFRILGTDIKKTEAKWQKEYTYNGTVQTPKPVITDKVTKKQLTEGQNYEIVSYSNNINAGTAKVTVRGIGAYSGTTTFSFKIKPASASAVTVAFANGSKDQPYEKGGVKPKPIVTLNGILLTEGTDYTLSYKNNTVCPEKSGKKPTVVIKGKKNLTGSKEEPFNIIRKDIGEIGLLLLPDVEYNSKAGKFRTTPQLFDTNGKKLAAGTDYDKDIQYQSGGKNLDNSDALNAGATITVTIKGKGAYDKTITGTYRIIDKGNSITKAKVKVNKTFYYTGEDIELTKDDLTVTLSNNEQVKDYRIIPYPNNPKKGSAKFLLVGEGNYGGQKTISITIKPQGMKWWE